MWNFQVLIFKVWTLINKLLLQLGASWGYFSKAIYVLAAEAHTLKMYKIKNNICFQKHEIFKFYFSSLKLVTNQTPQITNINGALS